MSYSLHKAIGKLFKDKYGNLVILQKPNAPLWAWIIFKAMSLLLEMGQVRSGFEQLSMTFLFIWSYLELTRGVNYIRKLLGLVVIVAIAASYFK